MSYYSELDVCVYIQNTYRLLVVTVMMLMIVRY